MRVVRTTSRRWLKDQRFVGPTCHVSGAQRTAGGGGKPIIVNGQVLSKVG